MRSISTPIGDAAAVVFAGKPPVISFNGTVPPATGVAAIDCAGSARAPMDAGAVTVVGVSNVLFDDTKLLFGVVACVGMSVRGRKPPPTGLAAGGSSGTLQHRQNSCW
jgi:hypothetical protein